jgi:hypothetical protein
MQVLFYNIALSCIAELNSTAASTSEGSASDAIDTADQTFTDVEVESDENDENDAIEDILYMRGASFTIHLDLLKNNASYNESRLPHRDEDTNEVPGKERKIHPTTQVSISTYVYT